MALLVITVFDLAIGFYLNSLCTDIIIVHMIMKTNPE